MKLIVNVYVEAVKKDGWTTFKSKDFEVKPFMITRREIGIGTGRYYYTAHFIGFGEMINCLEKSAVGERLYDSINRHINPQWKPPKQGWNGNVLLLKTI